MSDLREGEQRIVTALRSLIKSKKFEGRPPQTAIEEESGYSQSRISEYMRCLELMGAFRETFEVLVKDD